MTTQKAAVFTAIMNVFAEHSINFDEKQKPTALELLTKDMTTEVVSIVTLGIMSKEVDFSDDARAKHDTEEKVKGYVKGMVNNHLRKDLRLNGDEAYKAKNPGSRQSSGDEQLKEMKKLAAKLTISKDTKTLALVNEEIKKREATIAATKAKALAIDVSKLPESLRAFAAQIEPKVEETTDGIEGTENTEVGNDDDRGDDSEYSEA